MKSNPKPHKRSDRVGERIRAELMDLITRGALRDPGLSETFISDVKLSDDLRHARVYVRLLSAEAEVTDAQRKATLAGLSRAAGYIRRELAPRLKLKYHPELKFFWDENVDQARRVEALLYEIQTDAQGGVGEGEAK
jgi:ribosome-binding factor A